MSVVVSGRASGEVVVACLDDLLEDMVAAAEGVVPPSLPPNYNSGDGPHLIRLTYPVLLDVAVEVARARGAGNAPIDVTRLARSSGMTVKSTVAVLDAMYVVADTADAAVWPTSPGGR